NGGEHRRWAVHVSGPGSDTVTIEVAALHDAHLVIELDVQTPTCFFDDARYVQLQSSWVSHLDRGLAVARRAREVTAQCTGSEGGDPMTWLELPMHEFAAQPFGERRIGTVAERLDLEQTRLAHVELDLAKRISQVLPDLATAFVVDASRSVVESELEAQRAVIRAYDTVAPR